MIKQFNVKQFILSFACSQLKCQSTQFKCQRVLSLSIYRTTSGAAAPGQSGPRGNGNEGVLCISKTSRCTVASPSVV